MSDLCDLCRRPIGGRGQFSWPQWLHLRSGASVYFSLHTGDPSNSGVENRVLGNTERRPASYIALTEEFLGQRDNPSWKNDNGITEQIAYISAWWSRTGAFDLAFTFPLTKSVSWSAGKTFTMTSYSLKRISAFQLSATR